MSELRIANIEQLTKEIEALLSGVEETVAPRSEDRDASWERQHHHQTVLLEPSHNDPSLEK